MAATPPSAPFPPPLPPDPDCRANYISDFTFKAPSSRSATSPASVSTNVSQANPAVRVTLPHSNPPLNQSQGSDASMDQASGTQAKSPNFTTLATGAESKSSSQKVPEGFNWAKNLFSAGKIPDSTAEVTTSSQGRPRVKIPNAVFERGANLHSEYIVGIFYGKAPSYGKIWAVLNYLWGKDRKVTIHHLSKNAYLFYIPSQALRRRVLEQELWRVGDSPFFVTEWKYEFSTNPPSLDRAPVWATIKGIPFDLITLEGLSIICKPLGKAVDSKPFTSITSAEVKVIVDLTKPLASEIELECEDGKILVLAVTYPWLPPLCPHCHEIGHKISLCPSAPPKENQQPKDTKAKTEQDWRIVNRNRKKDGKEKAKHTELDSAPVSELPSESNVLPTTYKSSPDAVKNAVSEQLSHSQRVKCINPVEIGTCSLVGLDVQDPKIDTEYTLAKTKGIKNQMLLENPVVITVTNAFTVLQPEDSEMLEVDKGGNQTSVTGTSLSSPYPVQSIKKRKTSSSSSPIQGGVLSLEWKNNHNNH